MKKQMWVVVLAVVLSVGARAEPPQKAVSDHMKWWSDARYGMFIHWGLPSLYGGEISWSRTQYGASKYDSLALRFNPVRFDAQAWAQTAKQAGMRYVVLTAKHHDGFCLWDTRTSDHNIMRTPYGRDICRAFADAVRAEGLRLGWYISVRDWKDPDCADPARAHLYAARLKEQVRELLTHYGKVDLVWFDYDGWVAPVDPAEIFALCKELQPDVVINNRLEPLSPDEAHARVGRWGEYATPEQFVGSYGQTPWECCANLAKSGQWAIRFNDEPRTVNQMVDQLMHTLGGNGNLLLNVGPDSLGVIPPAFVQRLSELGAWTDQYAPAIYQTTGGPLLPTPHYVTTRRGHTFYITTFAGVAPRIPLPVGLASMVERVEVMGPYAEGKTARLVATDRKNPYVELSASVVEAPHTVVRVTCRRSVEDWKPTPPPSTSGSLAYYAPATASSAIGQYYHAPSAAFDDNTHTAWVIGRQQGVKLDSIYGSNLFFGDLKAVPTFLNTAGWLEVDLGAKKSVGRAVVSGRPYYIRTLIEHLCVQYEQAGSWHTVAEQRFDQPAAWDCPWQVSFPPVRAARWRLLVKQGSGYFGVSEFQLFEQ